MLPLILLLLLPASVSLEAEPLKKASPGERTAPGSTQSLIENHGLPDYRVPVETMNDEEYLLLYDTGDTTDTSIDVAYWTDAETGIEEKILLIEEPTRRKTKREESNWLDETVDELRETVRALKESRDSMNRSVHALPGFNQFDEVEVLSDEMKFRIGTREDTTNTTIIYEPTKETLSLTVRIPFGH